MEKLLENLYLTAGLNGIIAIMAFLMILPFVILLIIVVKRRKEINCHLQEHFLGDLIILKNENASFFGLKSLGSLQARGNGTLILSERELYFALLLPKKLIPIRLDSIHSIETPKSFLGKSVFRELLQVNYTNIDGQSESIAWFVKDLDKWVMAIKGRISSL